MIGAALRRGIAAGLLAGVLAGLVGLAVGEPALDDAVALEEAAAGAGGHTADVPPVTRPVQKVGLVVGTALVGLAVGAVFGVAAAWAVGRLHGDVWERSLKMGAVLIAALVLLPALKYPPNPPGIGDPNTVAQRTSLYLVLGVVGLLLAAGAWSATRELAASQLSTPVRQTVVGLGLLAVAAVVLTVLPALPAGVAVPAELLWSFRLGALATQLVLCGGTAVGFGLLSHRAERRVAEPTPAP